MKACEGWRADRQDHIEPNTVSEADTVPVFTVTLTYR